MYAANQQKKSAAKREYEEEIKILKFPTDRFIQEHI